MRFTFSFILLAGALCAVASSPAQDACTVETIAGDFIGPPPGDGGPGPLAELVNPRDVRVGPDGAVYISDFDHRVIRRVGVDGVIETFAGTGARGFRGDGGSAAAALLTAPSAMAFGPDGSLYFMDVTRLRRIDPSGRISTFAGNGEFGVPEIGADALSTPVGVFRSLAVDSNSVLYAAGGTQHKVYSIGQDGIVRLFAGRLRFSSGSFGGDGGPAVDALFDTPTDVAVDSTDRVYILDSDNRRIRRVGVDGVIETYLGGPRGANSPVGTPREEVVLQRLRQIEIDGQDRLYWNENESVRRLPLDGTLETAILLPDRQRNFTLSVSADARVHLIRESQVFEVDADGTQALLAGSGRTAARGDGGPARRALLGSVTGLAAGPGGEIHIADRGFFRIRKIGADGRMERIAGTGAFGFAIQEGGPADESPVQPRGMAVDSQGRVVFSDSGRVLRVEADGALSLIAGDPVSFCDGGSCGDGGPAREATIRRPDLVAADALGNIYIRENRRRRNPTLWLRRINAEGVIETVTERDPSGKSHGRASSIAMTPDGRLLVSTGNRSTAELWSFSAEDEQHRVPGFAGFFFRPRAMAVHPNGDVYMAETFGGYIRRLDSEGRRHDVVGDPLFGFAGGDGPISELRFGSIGALAFTPDGDLLIADNGNRRLLRIRDIAACPTDPRPQVAIRGYREGASFGFPLSPGTIFSVFGRDMGPEQAVLAELTGGGFPTSIAGTRVLFDGVPAPLIFAQDGQIAGIVPWQATISRQEQISGQFVQLAGPVQAVVERNGTPSVTRAMNLVDASPGFFTLNSSGSGLAAALNEDGTVNGPLNPAAGGSVLVLFGTGFGLLDPPGADGRITGLPLQRLVTPPTIQIRGQDAEVLYAGPAPGLVSGVIQINVRTPLDMGGALEIEATVGERKSAKVSAVVGR